MFNYEACKKEYLAKLEKMRFVRKNCPLNEKSKKELISLVKNKTGLDAKYEVIMHNNKETLILKRVPGMPIVEVLQATECFAVMAEAHLLEDHSPCAQMELFLKAFYSIPTILIDIFLHSCNVCNLNGTVKNKKKLEIEETSAQKLNKMYTTEFTVYCTIIPIQMASDNGLCYVIVYVDACTNYVVLRSTYSRGHHVVAYELLKIFLDFGIPQYLKVYYGDEYYKTILEILNTTDIFLQLPDVKCIKSKKAIDWATVNSISLLKLWASASNSPNWAMGLKEVQWQLNRTIDNNIIKSRKLLPFQIRSQYHAHFGFSSNDHVIKITNKSVKIQSNQTNSKILTFNDHCLKCREKVYDIYYKSCVVCKQKCHFNCCVTNSIQLSPNVYKLESICESCAEFVKQTSETQSAASTSSVAI
ncbi:uncharacterized protein LOC112054324 [Bicyclus anynana]|uniref:Uncharacterized protein LOC112054324 n=1 Tax=Bicyclus anynana TaxID=110368 RepID=A0A6J1NQ69_BICAN|nr:uncharacterized protein LOC112054324 [Bicyclus anynana]